MSQAQNVQVANTCVMKEDPMSGDQVELKTSVQQCLHTRLGLPAGRQV